MPDRLYVWIRSDLASMTPGKAAAQVAHAASQAAFQSYLVDDDVRKKYKDWESSPIQEKRLESKYPSHAFEGFGTTIVLDGIDDTTMEELYAVDLGKFPSHGIIVDPSYPLRDGRKMLFIEMLTCVWLFADSDNPDVDRIVKRFSLYNGNAE